MALGALQLDLPQYDCEDFRTDFRPKRGPGFFPGTDGHFHGCSAEGSRRIVFFGTDFGPERYWNDEVTDGRGEKRTQRTLRNLRSLVEEAGVDPCSCHLTNSVLALARSDPMTGNERVYAQHPEYESGKELVSTRPGEPDVLWMFHPSFRHANPQFRQVGTPDEKRRRREQVWAATIERLSSYK